MAPSTSHPLTHAAGVTTWIVAAGVLHGRVVAVAFDRLTARLVELHAPVDGDGGQPVCCGCDQAERHDPPALWPCRSYTLLAACLLGIAPSGVEVELVRLLTGAIAEETASGTAGDDGIPAGGG